MRFVIVSATLFVLCLAFAGTAEGRTNSIDWIDTLGEALTLTRADRRPLLVYFPHLPSNEGEPSILDDATVAASLRGFNCVRVGKDTSNTLRSRFSVNAANPTYIVLNAEGEKIHRWSGWMPAASFLRRLEQALGRYDLYLAGASWDAVTISDRDDLRSIRAPEDSWIRGLAMADDRLWVLHGSKRLYAVDPVSGDVLKRVGLPDAQISAMTGVDNRLFLVSYGWTKGDPIYRFDVRTGEVDAEIVTEKNKANKHHAAHGIAAHADLLYVAHSPATISTLDVESGDELRRFRVTWDEGLIVLVRGIEHDGQHLYGVVWVRDAARQHAASDIDGTIVFGVATIDDETGRVLDLLGFPLAKLALFDGVFVVGDDERHGYDRRNRPRRTFPPDHVRISFAYP